MLAYAAFLMCIVAISAIPPRHVARPGMVHAPFQNLLKCKPSWESCKFMWHPDTHKHFGDWYTITNISISAPSRRNSNSPKNKLDRVYYIEEQFAFNMDTQYNESVHRVKPESELLRNNHFNSPDFKLSFFDKYYDVDRDDGYRLATFHNVLSNHYGVIVDPEVCNRHIQIGGCATGHGKVFKFETPPEEHDLVVALGSGASGTWHFPMELLVALRNVPQDMLSNAIIHVPPKTAYMVNWLLLIPGVKESNIRDTPVIRAKTLLVPEMGFCAFPAPTHLEWLDSAVKVVDVATQPGPAAAPHHPTTAVHRGGRRVGDDSSTTLAPNGKNIILVQRSGSRRIENKDAVREIVKEFARNNGYNFVLQDDQHLPSIAEQVTRFRHSDIVVMPHGAGGVFINFSPERACVMEFLPSSGWNTCYARIAYIRNLNYISHMMNGSTMDPQQLKDGLKKCVMATTLDKSTLPKSLLAK